MKQVSAPNDLLQGTLDMLILKVLALEPMHGFGIAQRIEQISGERLKVQPGSLYPALHRLTRHKSLLSEWKTTENNRTAKYYRLSATGKRQLDAETQRWHELSAAVLLVLNTTGV